MSFLFFSGGRSTTLSSFRAFFFLRWSLYHPVYYKYTLFFDKKQAFSKLALEYI